MCARGRGAAPRARGRDSRGEHVAMQMMMALSLVAAGREGVAQRPRDLKVSVSVSARKPHCQYTKPHCQY